MTRKNTNQKMNVAKSLTSASKKKSIPKVKKNVQINKTPILPNNAKASPTVFDSKKWYLGIGLIMVFVFSLNAGLIMFLQTRQTKPPVTMKKEQEIYWFMLHRKSQKEFFYRGIPGDPSKSKLLRTFDVKVGIPGERPTPLPQLLGREYWKVIDEMEQFDNPETFPYFLTLDIPVPSIEPFGPSPYMECNGQCNWILPGAFGLHGIASDSSRLSSENPGSSGCIRHTDEDITYLYHLLDPKKEEIRYYIEDK